VSYYRSNFDFEKQLSLDQPIYPLKFNLSKVNYEFEYLFFFCGFSGVLNSPVHYPSKYFDYLSKLFDLELRSEKKPQSDYNFWWGDLSLFNISKKINNKEFFWKFCIDNNIPYPKSSISSNEIGSLGKKIIARPKLGFSGIGHKFMNNEPSKIIGNDYIFSEYFERGFDFGLLIDNKSFSLYQNITKKNGQYRGSLSMSDERSSFLNSEARRVSKIVRKSENFRGKLIQLDGFVTLEKKIYFNEVNYRFTLGRIFHLIMCKWFPNQKGKLSIVKYSDYCSGLYDKSNNFCLTPKDNGFEYQFGLVLEIS